MWTCVVETLEGISYVGKHGEVYLAIRVVPVNVHSKVSWSSPVIWNGVVLSENGHKVVAILLAYVLDSEIIHTEGKRDGMPGVGPEACDKTDLTVPPF